MENDHPDLEQSFLLDRMMHNDSRNGASAFPIISEGPMEDQLFQNAMGIMDTMMDYREFLAMCSCAMQNVQARFETLDQEFKLRFHRNPIHSIETRLKSGPSIAEKAVRKGINFTPESIEANIHDIAGVRVICSFTDDTYFLAEALSQQDDVTVLERKDYIAHPKPNGYRSLHLIIKVPVYFSKQKRSISVEIQFRTIAMDFWASLEHQLKYKHEVQNQEEIVSRLKMCADTIANLDREMLMIRQQIETHSEPSKEDQMMDILQRLGRSIT